MTPSKRHGIGEEFEKSLENEASLCPSPRDVFKTSAGTHMNILLKMMPMYLHPSCDFHSISLYEFVAS